MLMRIDPTDRLTDSSQTKTMQKDRGAPAQGGSRQAGVGLHLSASGIRGDDDYSYSDFLRVRTFRLGAPAPAFSLLTLKSSCFFLLLASFLVFFHDTRTGAGGRTANHLLRILAANYTNSIHKWPFRKILLLGR